LSLDIVPIDASNGGLREDPFSPRSDPRRRVYKFAFAQLPLEIVQIDASNGGLREGHFQPSHYSSPPARYEVVSAKRGARERVYKFA
jgi:hypothetical protein